MRLQLVEARWRVGYIRTSELPSLAGDLLAGGLDAPALRELAAVSSGEPALARQTFERALRELGQGGMTATGAALALADEFAERLLAGTLAPRTAARAISLLRWKGGADVDEHVLPFEHLDEEYGELQRGPLGWVGGRRLDGAVRRQARKLLDR